MAWRFIDLGVVDCFTGPAVFEAVMVALTDSCVENTVLFWRPDKPCIYVGFHQEVHADINVDLCLAEDVPIIRRILGGGPGLCDRNQIIYNIIYREEGSGIPRGPVNVYRTLLVGVVEALRLFGLNDVCIDEERFSVYVNGRKISGSGQLTSKGVVNSGGSFLIDFDYMLLERLFRNPVKNLRPDVVKPEEGLTSLKNELGRDVAPEEAKQALKEGFEKILGKTTTSKLSDYEIYLTEQLREKYMKPEWTFRADIKKRKRTGAPIKH